MSQIFNSIGSLTTLKSSLKKNNIHDFNSIKEILEFQKKYSEIKKQIILDHITYIEQEKLELNNKLKELEISIEKLKKDSEDKLNNRINSLKLKLNILNSSLRKNLIYKSINKIKIWVVEKKIKNLENSFTSNVQNSISSLVKFKQKKQTRYDFINNNFDEAINLSAKEEILEVERKYSVIKELNTFIYGAIGEQKVVKTIETLSDDYYLINDFDISFYDAIYNPKNDEIIKSIQIDHILVSPSGIFIIETKNWSDESLQNSNLRSPVQQILRGNYVLFKLLNNYSDSFLNYHHWGDKKLIIRNLLVFINNKPKEEFQYVKIVTLNELLNYINYFKPIYTSIETQRIAEFLQDINDKKII